MGKLKKGSVIWICRHGERVDNVSRNWREDFPHLARDNPPMNDRGRTQAKEVGERLAQEPGFDHIFSSPFRRCVETAHIIAQATGNTIKIEPGICEILYRFPPGFEPAESMHKEYDSIDLTYKPTGVTLEEEAYDEDVQERVSETLKRIFSVHSGQILLVGHGASVGGMIKELSGSWSYVGQCTLTKFIYEGGSDFMHGMRGNADHLSDKTNLRPFQDVAEMDKLKKGSVIWICRHGERVDNVRGNWRKQFPHLAIDNPPMTDRGRAQAKEVGERLAQEPGFDHIFSSPFRRCVETAHIIAQATGNTIKIEPGISEVLQYFPPGFEPAESMHKEYDSIDLSYKPTGVKLREEDYDQDVQERISETLKRLFSVYSGQILLVGHGASIGGMITELSGSWSYVGQCTLTKFIYEGGSRFRNEMLGNADHLSDRTNLRAY